MLMLKFYADESYNNRTFSFGGWLAEDKTWTRIESQWKKRIEYERRRWGQFDRYHASDCAHRMNDYANWTVPEQIQHVKKLLAVLVRRRDNIMGVCSGLNLTAMKSTFTGNKDPLEAAYNLAVRRLMVIIYGVIKHQPEHRVAIIHDRTPGYDGVILDAFNSMLNDPSVPHYKQFFTTIAPMGWEDCIPLQPADMLAYEGFKAVDADMNSTTARMRKSMQNLVGNGVKMRVRYLGKESFDDLDKMISERTDPKEVEI